MATLEVEPDVCPRCKGRLRIPAAELGLHHLDMSLGRDICPKCWAETQKQRAGRQKRKEVFDVEQYPTLFRQRLHAEIRQLLEERNAARKERDEFRRQLDADKKAAAPPVFTLRDRIRILLKGH